MRMRHWLAILSLLTYRNNKCQEVFFYSLMTQSGAPRKYSFSDCMGNWGETRITGATLSEVPQTLLPGRSESPHFLRRLNCFLLESDDLCRDHLRKAVAGDRELTLVGEAGTASEGLTYVNAYKPDLLLLGVELADSSGFDFVGALRRTSVAMPEVIFVSSCERHAMKALDASAAGYLLKPIDETKLATALSIAKDRASAKVAFQATTSGPTESSTSVHSSRIIVKSQGRMVFVPADTIDWVQANRNYLTLHVGRDQYKIRESIQSFERRLRPFPFLRIHRSTIVNVHRIREVERWYTGEYIVRLSTGKELTLSKTYRDQFFAATTPPAS